MKRFKQVLYTDDDADDGELFKTAIRNTFKNLWFYYFEKPHDMFSFLQDKLTGSNFIIFIDLNMPGKNGLQCIKQIRSDPKLDKIPVVVYTTSNLPEDIYTSYAAGANLYIRKPFTYPAIIEILTRIFNLDYDHYYPQPSFEDFYLK